MSETYSPFAILCAFVLLLFAPISTASGNKKESVMDLDAFWTIIDGVHARAGNDLDARIKLLDGEMAKRSLDDIQAFQRYYDRQIVASFRWDLWGAAYVMNGGCSDDGFRYFRDWLISEGRKTFESAMKSPDSLADLPKVELAENELFGYVALHAYEAKGGGELDRDMSTEAAEPQGKPWDEADLPQLFPRLSKKYQ
jgi:hypothetical protein